MEESPKKQYDVFLGGSQRLPNDVNVFNFASARAKEIEIMRNSIQNPKSTKLIFQKLPIHMRRRVMSHNAKRLPRRLREGHLSQLSKAGMPPPQKRPSRKHRRRPANLQNEYLRRQRSVTWLETHLWHAKRFHMVQRWGYKLADRPCDKAFRALYRASAKHCLIQDMSYLGCIEISGNITFLLERFKQITSTDLGLSLGAKSNLSGCRESHNTFFYPNTYPKKPIGEITYFWKNEELNEVEKTIWIWAHASFYLQLIELLISLFEMANVVDIPIDNTKNQSSFIIPTYRSSVDSTCELRVLKYELNRFRLTGPLSQAVLKNSINLANEENISEKNWFHTNYKNNSTFYKKQHNFWTDLHISSPAELPPHLICGLVITDPRFQLPAKRSKANQEIDCSSIPNFDKDLPKSDIWNSEIRHKCVHDQLSNSEICTKRSEQLVPGGEDSLSQKTACTPILLIQRPGNQSNHLGYGSGYDIITPNKWGVPLWITMIMWGARAGGLRENRVSILENQRGHPLRPDTTAGKNEIERKYNLLLERYFRLPPNKRINYTKIGIVSPFQCDWPLLVREWTMRPDVDEYHVLRDRNQLRSLQLKINGTKVNNNIGVDLHQEALVAVKLTLCCRGLIRNNAIICLLGNEDNPKQSDPVEPRHTDEHQEERKQFRRTHLKLLKKLKRQRMRTKKQANNGKTTQQVESTSDIADQCKRMRALWLPKATSVRYSCSRQVMGFVSDGDFSFCQAKSCGVGYVCLQAFSLLKNNLVLVRNSNSRQYRYAVIDIIL